MAYCAAQRNAKTLTERQYGRIPVRYFATGGATPTCVTAVVSAMHKCVIGKSRKLTPQPRAVLVEPRHRPSRQFGGMTCWWQRQGDGAAFGRGVDGGQCRMTDEIVERVEIAVGDARRFQPCRQRRARRALERGRHQRFER